MVAVVVDARVRRSFGLTVSENTDVCLRTRGMEAVKFEIKAAGQSELQKDRSVYLLGGSVPRVSLLRRSDP